MILLHTADYIIVLMTAFALAADAFAVSITNGMSLKKISLKRNAFFSAVTFAFFQGIMPLIGFLSGQSFAESIQAFDHWIAVIFLSIIGIKSIADNVNELKYPKTCSNKEDFTLKLLVFQGVATSIDALAVGITLGMINVNIFASSFIISTVTFFCCFSGVIIGRRFGDITGGKAGIISGVVLIFVGISILIDHLHEFEQFYF